MFQRIRDTLKREERLIAKAKDEVYKEIEDWDQRRKQAEARGEPFMEPPPAPRRKPSQERYGKEWHRRRGGLKTLKIGTEDAIPLSEFLFSFKGRINRLQYLCYLLMCLLVFGLLLLISGVVLHVGLPENIWLVLVLSFLLVWLCVSCIVSTKRLQDINISGWCLLLGLIPAIGWIVLLVILCCLPGTPGVNNYGEHYY